MQPLEEERAATGLVAAPGSDYMCCALMASARCDAADGLLDGVAFRFGEAHAHRVPVLAGCKPDLDFLILVVVTDHFADLGRLQAAEAGLQGFGFADLEAPDAGVLLAGDHGGNRRSGLEACRGAARNRRELPDHAVSILFTALDREGFVGGVEADGVGGTIEGGGRGALAEAFLDGSLRCKAIGIDRAFALGLQNLAEQGGARFAGDRIAAVAGAP